MADLDQQMAHSPRDTGAREAQLAKLNASIARGIADLDAGRSSDIETVFSELSARYAAWPTKKPA